ncbi:hypothetical protein ASPTUDRAFT_575277 [Aspergillus tubingensis CBS 134.48]|uniref:Uncharacterized protein n=1 Tax=Aspergillus tubingensis (strain CBS 134.48) TaxID=767770 RepID=A0A1L9N867_ASPTC|nr:hypothetical protein ASPTUDRAFT_575277 [Aspergillus tubingensis CBS 134.48]
MLMGNGDWRRSRGAKVLPACHVRFSSAILGYVWCSTVIKDNISSAGVVLYELGCGECSRAQKTRLIRHGFRIRRGFHNYSFRDPVFFFFLLPFILLEGFLSVYCSRFGSMTICDV